METPPPPVSTTKSGRIFGMSLGHAFRKNTAGIGGPELSRKLAQLVKMEKNVMRSLEQVSRERMEVARQISVWGEAGDDDVSDVTDKLGVLLYEVAELEDQLVDRYDQYRLTLKSIRNTEKSVQPSRDRKQKITDEIAKLKYKDPNSTKLPILEQELVRAEAESLVAEAQLTNITREKVKTAFTYHFDSMREHSEKVAIIANYGKHLLDLIDDNPVTPGETRNAYDGYEASKAIIQDCEQALTDWVPSSAAVKPALSERARTLSHRRRKAAPIPEEEQGVDGAEFGASERPMSMRYSSRSSSVLASRASWEQNSHAPDQEYQSQQHDFQREQQRQEFDDHEGEEHQDGEEHQEGEEHEGHHDEQPAEHSAASSRQGSVDDQGYVPRRHVYHHQQRISPDSESESSFDDEPESVEGDEQDWKSAVPEPAPVVKDTAEKAPVSAAPAVAAV
ncbi:hypothetical protein KEM55_001036 [Ascosphaera atra]|nr:hypothetical protein KEM55_001036 [Ascosphaera atra]